MSPSDTPRSSNLSSVPPSGNSTSSNKRSRTESEDQLRCSPIEQDRVAQRKQPAKPATPLGPTPILRVSLPIPSRSSQNMALASTRYDPGDFSGLPTALGENPHMWRTRRGSPPIAPSNLRDLMIPDTDFPHAHIPAFRIDGNVLEDQVQRIREITNPKVAIVIHGGGQELASAGGLLKEKVLELLSAITFPPSVPQHMDATLPDPNAPSSAIHIHLPIARKSRQSSAFSQPWSWFVDLGPNSQRLYEWLLYHEVFPITPSLSFSVHPFTATIPTVDDHDSDVARKQVLKDIKAFVWMDRDFTVCTTLQVQRNWGLSGNPVTLLKHSTDTLHIVNVVAKLKSSRKEVPAYLVYAKPTSNDKEEYLKWVAKFTSPGAYWRGAFRLDIGKATVECKLCKDTSHCARACPLATDGWTGTVVEDIYTTQELKARAARSSMAASSSSDHDWQRVRERRVDTVTRPHTMGRSVQKSPRKGPRRDGQGKGKGVRR
ncbi:hypothetical protein BD309DRAFT_993976 [Dichomitus squalens]|uniref:Uncharacterized protein n=1 Tax=Dichomitus squalens TaxID=114155 RepID=A0A4Q9PY80_9APHY|nr:hypothetical protein BD309DRAFT_993976 [Dichomitus squalens]TBU59732.1 hypothetical protein BD310DRAFT_947840 [Dichomitus squalens]